MAHFIRSGHGPEDGLLLHCMLADARSLDGLSAKLAGSMRMLSMDLPGHGQSEDWDKTRDYAEMARDMAVGLLERPVHIVGHSYGAYLALRIAVDHPELVRSLTLIEPVFFAAAKQGDPAGFKAYERSSRAFMGAIAVGDLVSAARAFTGDWGDGKPWESLKPDAMDYITSRMPLVAASSKSITRDNGDVLARLGDIDVPCLLLEGAQSPPIVSSILDGLEQSLPNTTRDTIAEAGHMSALTHPIDVAALVGAFVDDQPRSSDIS